MPWFKVDDGFASSRQILSIPPRHRTKAAGLWVLAGAWSAKELTDGFIPDYVLRDLAATVHTADQLVQAGLWERVSNGYNFVAWASYQFTKSQVTAHRANDVERKRRARERAEQLKAQRAEQEEQENVRPESARVPPRIPPGIRAASALPDQTRPDQTHISNHLGGNLTLEGPPRRCPRHLNLTDPPPCGACADARRLADEWQATLTAERERAKASHRAVIESCSHCDANGFIELDDDTLTHCDHTPTRQETSA